MTASNMNPPMPHPHQAPVHPGDRPHVSFNHPSGPVSPTHLANQLHQLHIQRDRFSPSDESVSRDLVDDIDVDEYTGTCYVGYTLYKAPAGAGSQQTWKKADKTRMSLGQDDLADLVRRMSRRTSIVDQYQSLTNSKKHHVDRLIEDLRQSKPQFQWSCVYVKEEQRDVRSKTIRRGYETTSMAVIFMGKSSNRSTNRSPSERPIQHRDERPFHTERPSPENFQRPVANNGPYADSRSGPGFPQMPLQPPMHSAQPPIPSAQPPMASMQPGPAQFQQPNNPPFRPHPQHAMGGPPHPGPAHPGPPHPEQNNWPQNGPRNQPPHPPPVVHNNNNHLPVPDNRHATQDPRGRGVTGNPGPAHPGPPHPEQNNWPQNGPRNQPPHPPPVVHNNNNHPPVPDNRHAAQDPRGRGVAGYPVPPIHKKEVPHPTTPKNPQVKVKGKRDNSPKQRHGSEPDLVYDSTSSGDEVLTPDYDDEDSEMEFSSHEAHPSKNPRAYRGSLYRGHSSKPRKVYRTHYRKEPRRVEDRGHRSYIDDGAVEIIPSASTHAARQLSRHHGSSRHWAAQPSIIHQQPSYDDMDLLTRGRTPDDIRSRMLNNWQADLVQRENLLDYKQMLSDSFHNDRVGSFRNDRVGDMDYFNRSRPVRESLPQYRPRRYLL
ncbi:uncharacterized protein BDV14DRAFT_55945 [Aspergillus stella-maris]|uniref:uncharacterized protein n=1 Tax=Aspergillus stella-maris TaxID=1810926 RepID=UPI003CCD952E